VLAIKHINVTHHGVIGNAANESSRNILIQLHSVDSYLFLFKVILQMIMYCVWLWYLIIH